MAEYKYVSLPTEGKRIRNDPEAGATEELNEYAAAGWEVVGVTRPGPIGPIGFLLRRG